MTTQTIDMVLEQHNPSEVVIDVNVRTRVNLNPQFLDSIRTLGVLQPVTGWKDDDGKVHVTIGQRRALAAAQTGVTLPVIIKPRSVAETEQLGEAQRVIDQLAENDHRSNLVDAEHAAAYEQLSLFGLPIDEIAKRTGAKRAVVRSAVKLQKEHPEAAAVMHEEDLTLDQAAELVQFEDDTELQRSIAESARRGEAEFRAAVVRAETERKLAAELEQIREGVPDGVEWLDPEVLAEVADQYVNLQHWERPTHKDTGERIDEKAAKKLGIFTVSAVLESRWDGGTYRQSWWPLLLAHNPTEHGYVLPKDGKGPLSEAEKAARREKREARNEWSIATTVRQEWLKGTLLPQQKMPDGALLWVLKTQLKHIHAWHPGNYNNDTEIRTCAEQLLGIDNEDIDRTFDRERPALMEAATKPGDATLRVALAHAIACMEQHLSNPKSAAYGQDTMAAAYLQQLHEWGYSLTDIERKLTNPQEQTDA